MKNKEIYLSALHLIGERADAEENDDYEERAPYLLAAFCSETSMTDTAYREFKNLGETPKTDSVRLPLDSEFPFAERFVHPASLYLAAMLIIDENTELSDKLFDKYCVAMATIESEIPLKIEKITDIYGDF